MTHRVNRLIFTRALNFNGNCEYSTLLKTRLVVSDLSKVRQDVCGIARNRIRVQDQCPSVTKPMLPSFLSSPPTSKKPQKLLNCFSHNLEISTSCIRPCIPNFKPEGTFLHCVIFLSPCPLHLEWLPFLYNIQPSSPSQPFSEPMVPQTLANNNPHCHPKPRKI